MKFMFILIPSAIIALSSGFPVTTPLKIGDSRKPRTTKCTAKKEGQGTLNGRVVVLEMEVKAIKKNCKKTYLEIKEVKKEIKEGNKDLSMKIDAVNKDLSEKIEDLSNKFVPIYVFLALLVGFFFK
jgi:hypothetical protein